MAVNISTLSPAQLKELKNSESIIIRHARSQQEVEEGASCIIREQFPKAVATAFSTIWASVFPSINKMNLKEMSRPKGGSVTIVGGPIEVVKMIMDWMLSCCEGKGMQKFQPFTDKPFTRYFIVKENADNMGISVLSKEMDHRLEMIARKQIHSEDVRAMYRRLPAAHPILKDIAMNIANLIWDRELKAFGAYRTLREEIPQFDKDLNEILEPRVAARKEKKAKHKAAQEAERVANNRNNKNAQNNGRSRRLHGVDAEKEAKVYPHRSVPQTAPESARSTTNIKDQDNTQYMLQHKTLHCAVARKARGRRPAYVVLDLADIGVNKDDYTGESFMSTRSTAKPKRFEASDNDGQKQSSDQNKPSKHESASPALIPSTNAEADGSVAALQSKSGSAEKDYAFGFTRDHTSKSCEYRNGKKRSTHRQPHTNLGVKFIKSTFHA